MINGLRAYFTFSAFRENPLLNAIGTGYFYPAPRHDGPICAANPRGGRVARRCSDAANHTRGELAERPQIVKKRTMGTRRTKRQERWTRRCRCLSSKAASRACSV